jgi:hypothetical protein
MLDPARHVAKNPKPQYVYGEGPSKNGIFKIILIQLIMFNKDRHTAKSISLKR